MAAHAVRSGGGAARLRSETTDIHRQTEDEPFIVDLMAGRGSTDAYAALAVELRAVYATLESEVDAARRSAPAPMVALLDPALDRLPALDHDLASLGVDPVASGDVLPATSAYLARIRAAGAAWPRLLAHHYVRYLGDLSGGQVVATMLRRHYGLTDDQLTFFAFAGIDSKGGYKTRYRAGLDGLLDDPDTYAAMLDETRAAYAANRAIFAALDATV